MMGVVDRVAGRVKAAFPHARGCRGGRGRYLGLPGSACWRSALIRIGLLTGNINFFVKKSLKINIPGWNPIKSSDWQTIFFQALLFLPTRIYLSRETDVLYEKSSLITSLSKGGEIDFFFFSFIFFYWAHWSACNRPRLKGMAPSRVQ